MGCKDDATRATLLSMMYDDILCEFEQYHMAKELWDNMQSRLGVYMTAQLHTLIFEFYSYKMNPQLSKRQQLMHMINGLKKVGQSLTGDQEIQAIF